MIKNTFLKIDKLLDRHTPLLISLFVLLILRVPNFFDPYWYGDEAIYLTIGQSIRAGQRLYADIVDHKTPLIYYFAAVPNQFWFRVLLFFWMVITAICFYDISIKTFKSKSAAWLGTLLFVLLTTLPSLEGHIPNGELFVMGFVVVGLWILLRSGYLKTMLSEKSKVDQKFIKKQFMPLFGAGVLFGLGLLTKVPALLDFAGLMIIPWFYLFHIQLNSKPKNKERIIKSDDFLSKLKKRSKNYIKTIFNLESFKKFTTLFWHWLPMGLGLLLPIVASIIYFVSVGSGSDYLEFGLLYNFHYTQTFSPDFGNAIANFLFTLPGKTLVLAALLLVLTFIKRMPLKSKVFGGWYLLTLYSVLLSNRPYPHYFLQAVPPLVLLLSFNFELLLSGAKNILKKEAIYTFASTIFYTILTITIFTAINFGAYSATKYYNNFYRFMTGGLNQEEYYQTFNHLMKDNYQLSTFLNEQGVDRLFIWGNNAMLYALSDTVPASRFTVAFHIQDLKTYDETMSELKEVSPKYIVVMNNASRDYPDFYQYLNSEYMPNHDYNYMTLYKKLIFQND